MKHDLPTATPTAFTLIESARLILRPFRDDDLAPFHAYRNDPLVARYQSWDSITQQEAREFIDRQKSLSPGVPGQGFQIAVELKASGCLIGDCYLKIDAREPRLGEIGFTVASQFQRHGFAQEAVAALLDYAFGSLKLHRVVAVTDCENARAVALLERLGLRREGHFIRNVWFKGMWGDEFLYAILNTEWQIQQAPMP